MVVAVIVEVSPKKYFAVVRKTGVECNRVAVATVVVVADIVALSNLYTGLAVEAIVVLVASFISLSTLHDTLSI
jgi:hypothetical protein